MLYTQTVDVTPTREVEGAACLCSVCIAVTVRVDVGRCELADEAGTMMVCTPFEVVEGDEVGDVRDDDGEEKDNKSELDVAIQIASPADELVIMLDRVAVLMLVLELLEAVLLNVTPEIEEVDVEALVERSEHQGKLDIEEVEDTAAGANTSTSNPGGVSVHSREISDRRALSIHITSPSEWRRTTSGGSNAFLCSLLLRLPCLVIRISGSSSFADPSTCTASIPPAAGGELISFELGIMAAACTAIVILPIPRSETSMSQARNAAHAVIEIGLRILAFLYPSTLLQEY